MGSVLSFYEFFFPYGKGDSTKRVQNVGAITTPPTPCPTPLSDDECMNIPKSPPLLIRQNAMHKPFFFAN